MAELTFNRVIDVGLRHSDQRYEERCQSVVECKRPLKSKAVIENVDGLQVADEAGNLADENEDHVGDMSFHQQPLELVGESYLSKGVYREYEGGDHRDEVYGL